MLSREMYTEKYIHELHEKTGSDPALLERVIYAFSLLEAIQRVDLPFYFKGGTALMLLLKHPYRLSTDIDIVVQPGTNIDRYVNEAGKIFPFKSVDEDIRNARNNIEKRHFRFTYASPSSNKDVTILMDVLFEDFRYKRSISCPIRNELLLNEGDDLSVTIPCIDEILGEKLTAFAPHTTGIPFGQAKELEIIKQMYDCSTLFDNMENYNVTMTNIEVFNRDTPDGIFYQSVISYGNSNFIVLVIAVCIFEIFRRIKMPNSRIINFIGAGTFMVYLVHDNKFFYSLWGMKDWIVDIYNTPYRFMLDLLKWGLATFAAGLAVYILYLAIAKVFEKTKWIFYKKV